MLSRKTLKQYLSHYDSEKFCFIVSVIAFMIMYISVLRFILSTGISLLNSDASSEMVMALQLNHEKAFLASKNWFYSTEFRVIHNPQIIFRIALSIFPNNWHWARLLSVAMFLLILAGSIIWLMCAIGHKKYAFWAAVAIIAPFGRCYGWNVIFNSYYVPHITISIISLALMCEIIKSSGKPRSIKKYICIILLFALGFMSGLDGVRQLMICYVPLFAVGFILMCIKEKFLAKTFPAKTVFFTGFALCIISGIGYLINLAYISKHYYFKSYTDTMWHQFDLSEYIACISGFISLFGWQEDVPIFSLAGIVNVLSLLLVCIIFFTTMYLIIKVKLLKENEILAVMFFCMVFLIDLLFYAGTQQNNKSYWVTILPFSFVPLFILLSKISAPPQHKTALLFGYGLFLFLSSYATTRNPYFDPISVPNDFDIQNAAEWLSNTDYTQGIASFWNSNIITELTDGQIEMWTVGFSANDITPASWLQSVEHETLPDGNVFILLTFEEYNSLKSHSAIKPYIVYADDKFIIYGFDDISQYLELINE